MYYVLINSKITTQAEGMQVATLALTTLLKTGHESNVERLVKKITGFMSEIGDTFKIEVSVIRRSPAFRIAPISDSRS